MRKRGSSQSLAVVLSGPTGTGKTTIADASFNAARTIGLALIHLEADRFAPTVDDDHEVFIDGSYHRALYQSAACFVGAAGCTVLVDGLAPYGNDRHREDFENSFGELEVVRVGVTCSRESLIERSGSRRILLERAFSQLEDLHHREYYDLMIDTDATYANEAAEEIVSMIYSRQR